MEKYPLAPLLKVREYREDAAKNALSAAERAVVEAQEAVERCRGELERYKVWRQEEVERRYDAIMGKGLSLKELDVFKAGLGALAEKLVERILVSGPDGGHEIRLTLGKDVLPGTEIRLQRGSDGVLSVHLATDNAASFQTLVGAQESLKARLESFEKDVRVEVVSERGGAEAENGDGRRQSRGEYVAPDERDA